MADNDKLWFELGVRDEVSKTLSEILDKAEELSDVMESITLGKEAVRNAQEVEQALDRIAIARSRISEAKPLTTDKNTIKNLNMMDKELGEIEKKFLALANMGTDVTKAMMGTKGMSSYMKMLNNLPLALDQVRRRTDEIAAQAQADEKAKIAEEGRVEKLKEKYNELYRVRQQLQDAVMSAAPGTDLKEAISMINTLSSKMGVVTKSMNGGSSLPKNLFGADNAEFLRGVKEKTKELTVTTEEYNRTIKTTDGILNNINRIGLDTQSQRNIASIKKQTVEYDALDRKLQELANLFARVESERNAFSKGKVKVQIYDSATVNNELEAIQRRYNEALAMGRQREKEDTEAKREKNTAARKTAEAIQLIAHANQGLISSYDRVAQSGKKANDVTIQFQNQIGQFASLYGMERLLKSVITVGGQFEFQHIALQNILGDLQQANTLFEQLQTLAIESPKTFMELTAYTKQLSAYQIPYEELYDTTKRLADLSTGLGVDMSRLILAYGQVRSAAVLRGQELRQFTEAGIPLVQKLAEEFTRLNGKVVTTGEVFELISKRAVPFKMVQKILWDMTNEGGQFFDMQSKLADTLYGKWQKLQDQWQITLGHIAEGESLSGSFLKTMIEGLVKLTSMFDTLMPMFAMFGMGKLSKTMFNSGKNFINNLTGATAVNNMQLAKIKEANRLERERLMYGKELSFYEKEIVRTKTQLTSQNYSLLIQSGELTKRQAAQMIESGKINKLTAYRLALEQGITKEKIRQMTASNNWSALYEGEKSLSMLGKFKKGALAFMGGWIGVATTAAGIIMSLYSNATEKAEEAKNAAMGANEAIMKDVKSINVLYNELSTSRPKTNEETTAAIGRMTEALKECGRYTDELHQKQEAAADDTERYNILYIELQKISDEYLRMKDNVEAYLEAANNVGGGNWFTKMFNDPMSKDIKDWSEATIDKNVAKKGVEKYGASVRAQLEEYLKQTKKWAEEEMRSMDWSSIFDKLSEEERGAFKVSLSRNAGDLGLSKEEKKYWEDAYDALNKYIQALNSLNKQEEEVDSQMESYLEHIKIALEEKAKLNNLDFNSLTEWSDEDLRKLSVWINEIINSYHVDGETAENLRKKILNIVPDEVAVKLNIIPELKKEELAPWQQDVDKYFKDHKINIPIDAQSSLEKVEKQLQEKHQEFQDQMDKNGKILIQFGFDLSNLPQDIEHQISLLRPEYQNWVRHAFSEYNEGKSGTKNTTQAGKDLGLSVIKKTKSSGGSKTDQQLKKWREELKEIENFYNVYKRNAEYMSKDDAIKKAVDSGVFSLSKETINSIDDYLQLLKDFRDRVRKEMGKKVSEERKSFLTDLLTKIDDKEFEIKTKQAAEKIVKDTQEYISKQSEKWNLYKSLLEKTGSKEFALTAFRDGQVWDDLSREFADELKTRLEEKKVDLDIDILWTKTDAEAKETLKGVEGAYDLWKKIVDIIRKNYTENLTKGAEAYSNIMTDAEKIKKIEQEILDIQKERESIDDEQSLAANKAREDDAKRRLEQAKRDAFKNSNDYLNFYDAILSLTIDKAEEIGQKIRENLNDELKRGKLSARQYLTEIKRINEQLDKLRNSKSDLSAFLGGGIDGLLKNMQEKGDSMWQRGVNDYNQANKDFKSAIDAYNKAGAEGNEAGMETAKAQIDASLSAKEGASAMIQGGQAMSQGASAAMSTVSTIDMIVHGINNAVQGIKDAFYEIKEAAQASGVDTNSESWSEWGTFLSSFSSASNSATSGWDSLKNGNFGGVISGVVGSFTGWITGISKGWDAKMDRQIEYAQKQLKATERMRQVMEKQLERTLGGVYEYRTSDESLNKLREARNKTEEVDEHTYSERAKKGVQSFLLGAIGGVLDSLFGSGNDTYTVNYYNDDTRDMMEKAIESGTYYDEQLALLYKQRDELQHEYSAEWNKKDSDNEKLEDFKNQIEDLQEEIDNFVQDMAKALYNIDVKEWASQLGDALFEAWQQGSNGAEAFRKKSKEILAELAKNIATTKLVEKALEPVLNTITKEMTDKSGMLDEESVELIAEQMALVGQTMPDAFNALMDGIDAGVQRSGLGSLKDLDTSSGSTGSSIKGITENTADLLASYLNAVRADVSVIRITDAQYYPQFLSSLQQGNVIADSQLRELQMIAGNTSKNAQLVAEIRDMFKMVTPDKTSIRVK